jgi:hypothetical protein
MDLAVAGELGFEPRLTESESAVLPLNYSPFKALEDIDFFFEFSNTDEKFSNLGSW